MGLSLQVQLGYKIQVITVHGPGVTTGNDSVDDSGDDYNSDDDDGSDDDDDGSDDDDDDDGSEVDSVFTFCLFLFLLRLLNN